MNSENKDAAAAAAYKWAYEYLQSRMESIGRHSWAHDCDSEIEFRIQQGCCQALDNNTGITKTNDTD